MRWRRPLTEQRQRNNILLHGICAWVGGEGSVEGGNYTGTGELVCGGSVQAMSGTKKTFHLLCLHEDTEALVLLPPCLAFASLCLSSYQSHRSFSGSEVYNIPEMKAFARVRGGPEREEIGVIFEEINRKICASARRQTFLPVEQVCYGGRNNNNIYIYKPRT